MSKFKDSIATACANLSPKRELSCTPDLTAPALALVNTYNRIGGLLRVLADEVDIPLAAALAVWMVESGTWGFEQDRPLLRFEVHKFWQHWGAGHAETFRRHFQFGGDDGVTGRAWSNHKFRNNENSAWQTFHGNQYTEYNAFDFAMSLAGKELACLSASFGGPQILGSNHGRLGYDTAAKLFDAFKSSERWHVAGFFDYCASENILGLLARLDWHGFAAVYNGPGQADTYAELINDAYLLAKAVLQGGGKIQAAATTFDRESFDIFFSSLGVRHFKSHEFLFRGRYHSMVAHPAYGLNDFPPTALWPNIASLAQRLDMIRTEIGAPMILTSVYRTQAYNCAVGGALDSRHQRFMATDLMIKNNKSPVDWARQLRDIRKDKKFNACVGAHEESVHIDLRDHDADFSTNLEPTLPNPT